MTTASRATPWKTIATAAILGAAISLLVTGIFRHLETDRELEELKSRVSAAEAEAHNASNRATRAREQASELIDFFVENLREELEPIGRTDIIESAARQAELYFESLPPGETGASTSFHHAKMLVARAQAHYDQGALPESLAAFEKALEMLSAITGENDNQLVTDLLAAVHNELALTQSQAGDITSARANSEAALAIYQKLATTEPDEPLWTHGIAASQLGIAETLRRERRRDEAIPFYDQAIASAKKSIDAPQDDPNHIATLMYAHTNKGICLSQDDKFTAAEAECEAASAIAERLIELEPRRKKWKKEYATLVNNFGSLLDDQGQTERAREFIEKARGLRKELIAFDPNNGNWRYDLANSEFNLAMNYLERGEIPQAWSAAQQYLSHTSTMLRSEPDNFGWHEDLDRYLDTITDRFTELDAHVESAKTFEFVVRLYRDLSETDPENQRLIEYLASAHYGAGSSRKRSRDFESALDHQQQNLQLRLQLFHTDPQDPDRLYELGSAIGNHGQALYNLERYAESLKYFQFAYATYQKVPPEHRSRHRYLQLDEMNIRKARAKLGLIEQPPVIIPLDATWSYWDQGEAPAPGWQIPEFDANAWPTGLAQLGYGDGDEKTKLSFGPDPKDKFPTAYFRHEFEVSNPTSVDSIHINLIRDDGAIVYLNGVEVVRDLMPDGPADFSTLATNFTSDSIENDPIWFDLDSNVELQQGKNIIAAEIHQSDPRSSDLSFALALFKNANIPPPLEDMDNAAYQALLSIPKE